MLISSNVHTSLHSKRHQQIIYAKVNLKMFYPPPYERKGITLQSCKVRSYQKGY